MKTRLGVVPWLTQDLFALPRCVPRLTSHRLPGFSTLCLHMLNHNWCYMGSGDLNLHLHSCLASALSIEPSLQTPFLGSGYIVHTVVFVSGYRSLKQLSLFMMKNFKILSSSFLSHTLCHLHPFPQWDTRTCCCITVCPPVNPPVKLGSG